MDNRFCYNCMSKIKDDAKFCPYCGKSDRNIVTHPHHLPPGAVLKDRYLVGKVIGEGGFGITYIGRDNTLGIKVAVKEFYPSGHVTRNNSASNEINTHIGESDDYILEAKTRFLNEARVLAKFIDEKGIVGVRDYFEDNNTAYIIMDYIDGISLRQYVKRNGCFEVEDLVNKLYPLLKSLDKIHRENIVHRDISPENIMITSKGELELLDFGAAREVIADCSRSLSVVLKPGYAPEEQYRKKGNQGPWTDIYALCATFYYCVTGTIPEDSMERLFNDEVKSIKEIVPSCSRSINDVIMKGMAVTLGDRYKNITSFVEALEYAQEHPSWNGAEYVQKHSRDEVAKHSQDKAPEIGAKYESGQVAGKNIQNAGLQSSEDLTINVDEETILSNQPHGYTDSNANYGKVPRGNISQGETAPVKSSSKFNINMILGIGAVAVIAILTIVIVVMLNVRNSDDDKVAGNDRETFEETDDNSADMNDEIDDEVGEAQESVASDTSDISNENMSDNVSDEFSDPNGHEETEGNNGNEVISELDEPEIQNLNYDTDDEPQLISSGTSLGQKPGSQLDGLEDYILSSNEKIPVLRASATSYLGDVASDGQTYIPEHLIDGDHRTAWVDGKKKNDSSGDGVGEQILLVLDGSHSISKLLIYNGFLRTKYRYTFNGKVKRIQIEFEDGTSIERELKIRYDLGLDKVEIDEADMNPTLIELDEPVETSWVRFTILEVEAGENWHDTAISEIELY